MRRFMMMSAAALAMGVAPAAMAQAQGQGQGQGAEARGNAAATAERATSGALRGGPLGSGPPIAQPGQSDNALGTAEQIAQQRGDFGRSFADNRGPSQAEQARMLRERVGNYRDASADRRQDAFAGRDAARQGLEMSMSARDIRGALQEDMEAWREAFNISREDWQSQRDTWLVDADEYSAQEWAERRAMWFEARDTWIEEQVGWADDRSAAPDADDTD